MGILRQIFHIDQKILNTILFSLYHNIKLVDLSKENITHIAERYSWSPAGQDELRWQSIPRGTAVKIYKHYFADFGQYSYQFIHRYLHQFEFSVVWLLAR